MGPVAVPGQATALPTVFTARTLHDPATGAWNMNTCASSHLNSSVTSLSVTPSFLHIAAEANLGDNYHGEHYYHVEQYYHGE
ncbi:hypothetical protein Tco_0043818 [Tanacetum coccineum]